MVGRLPRYVRLGRALFSDPKVPRARKAVLVGALGYVASPIDLVPGIIPVAGQLDDLAAILFALRGALGAIPPAAATEHLQAAGLAPTAIKSDLETVGATAGWMARGAWRLAGRAAQVAGTGTRLAFRLASSLLPRSPSRRGL